MPENILTPEQIAAIRKRADKASPGPWETLGSLCVVSGYGTSDADRNECCTHCGQPLTWVDPQDPIATLRARVAELEAAERERIRLENERLRAEAVERERAFAEERAAAERAAESAARDAEARRIAERRAAANELERERAAAAAEIARVRAEAERAAARPAGVVVCPACGNEFLPGE